MRSEREMLEQILSVARADDRVRAVCMNGSRVNPAAPRDCFQDYDIVYLVTDVASYLKTPQWVDVFGERVVMQRPDDSALFPSERRGRYAYLMQFMDGNRIDLTLIPREQAAAYTAEDKLTAVLLDKDGLLAPLPPPSDADYHVRRPGREEFDACCNEFWWVAPYVAKGLWRDEFMYAAYHLNNCVRPMLEQMLVWRVGFEQRFAVSTGKCGKYLKRFLSQEDWLRLLETYHTGEAADVWRALFACCALFGEAGRAVGAHLGGAYPAVDEARVLDYLRHVQAMPPDAQAF